MDQPITDNKIKLNLGKMQDKKSPGLDEVVIGFVKFFSEEIIPYFRIRALKTTKPPNHHPNIALKAVWENL